MVVNVEVVVDISALFVDMSACGTTWVRQRRLFSEVERAGFCLCSYILETNKQTMKP